MKKVIFPRYSIISLSILTILFLVGLIADKIISSKIYFYTGLSTFTIDDFRLLTIFIAITLLISAIFAFILKNMKRKWLKIASITVCILIAVLVFIQFLVGIVAFSPSAYVELLSDDGEHHIVIAEDCYFFSPYGGDVFEKTSPYTMEKLTKYVANIDFYTPFSDGKYTVTWNEDNFELCYDSDGDNEIDEKILIQYLQ